MRPTSLPRLAGALLSVLVLAAPARASMLAPSHEAQLSGRLAELPEADAPGPISRWVQVADRLALGIPRPSLMAAVTMAMHDALNAAEPRNPRWSAAAADEPPAAGLPGEAVAAAAAFRVLLSVFPPQALRQEAEGMLLGLLRALPAAQQQPVMAAGFAIGAVAGARLTAPVGVYDFPQSEEAGRWRGTPPFRRVSQYAEGTPLLFPARDALHGPPPPALGTEPYLSALAEVRRLGAIDSTARTPAQTAAAEFWASQNAQRGFLYLAMRVLAEEAARVDPWMEAQALSILAAALADTGLMAWEEKRAHSHWRPVTAINTGGQGVAADPAWTPLLPTPPHPDFPSGHAGDCAAGAAVLGALFGDARPILYVAMEPAERPGLRFSSFSAAAENCADSRIWAGAHFRFANDEGGRIGRAAAAAALARQGAR